jgi:hypothetical protein
VKVVHQLGIAGDLATLRGRKGRIRLAKAPESINLGAIVRRIKADMELMHTLADLVAPHRRLAILLEIEPPSPAGRGADIKPD